MNVSYFTDCANAVMELSKNIKGNDGFFIY